MSDLRLNTPTVRRLVERLDKLRRCAIPPLTPLYRRGTRGQPEPVGTGLTISLDGEVVLVTAAHVSDLASRSMLHMGVGNDIVPIKGTRWTSPMPPGGEREEDRTDLAFWRLDLSFAQNIPEREVLQQSLLDATHSTPAFRGDNDHFVILGYPVTRQPRQPKDGEMAALPMTFIARTLSRDEYREVGRVPSEALLLEYDKYTSHSLEGPVVGPDLPGLSGGAIWYFPGLLLAQRGRPVLAGLAIRWRFADPKCIIATRLGPLLAAIRETRSR